MALLDVHVEHPAAALPTGSHVSPCDAEVVRKAFVRNLLRRGLRETNGLFDCSSFCGERKRRNARAAFWVSLVNHETRVTLAEPRKMPRRPGNHELVPVLIDLALEQAVTRPKKRFFGKGERRVPVPLPNAPPE